MTTIRTRGIQGGALDRPAYAGTVGARWRCPQAPAPTMLDCPGPTATGGCAVEVTRLADGRRGDVRLVQPVNNGLHPMRRPRASSTIASPISGDSVGWIRLGTRGLLLLIPERPAHTPPTGSLEKPQSGSTNKVLCITSRVYDY